MAQLATIARPYAKALYALAQEKNQVKPWLEMLSVLATVSVDIKIKSLFESNRFTKNEKLDIFLNIVEESSLHHYLKNFLKVLIKNNRLKLMSAVYESYAAMVLAVDKIAPAIVYSPYPLTDDELKELIPLVEDRCQTKLMTQVAIAPELIGGCKVKFGDQVLDMSVKSKLDALYQNMVS